jgi:hypothetical protein
MLQAHLKEVLKFGRCTKVQRYATGCAVPPPPVYIEAGSMRCVPTDKDDALIA